METNSNRADKAFVLVMLSAGLVAGGVSLAAGRVGLDSQTGLGPARVLLLAAGVSLSAISWWFLRSARVDERWPWMVALASLLVLGVGLRLLEVTYDRFNYDEYSLRIGIDRSFADYSKDLQSNNSLQFVVHYWLSERLLGSSPIAFRSMSLLASLALLLVTTLGLRRAWPADKTVLLVVLLILIVNAHAVSLSGYALFPYSFTFLLSAALFFLFMRLAEGPLDNRRWLWISAILPVAAFFSNEFLVVPLATGAFSVIVFRWARSAGSRNLATLWGWVWEFKPLLIFPAVYAIKQILFPYTLWGASLRADQVDLYFPTAGYAPTLVGMVQFFLAKTYALFWSVLGPGGVSDHPSIQPVFLAGCGFLAALALLQVARRRADGHTTFTALFLLTTLASIAIGSLLGFYPYGITRYTPYLFMPSAILIGIGGSIAYRWVFRGQGLSRSRNALLVWLAVATLAGGAYVCVARYSQIAKAQVEDAQAIAWLQTRQPDLILTDDTMRVVFYTKAPAIYAGLYSMGEGTNSMRKQDVVPSEMADAITGTGQSSPIDSILVVLYPNTIIRTEPPKDFAQRFPGWGKMIEANFDLAASIKSSHIEGQLYRRK
jgi:hypothetical protein